MDKKQKLSKTKISKKFSSKFKSKKVLIFAIAFILPLIIAFSLRLYSYNLPITDDWAEATIKNALKQSVASEINKQYPNLPSNQKEILINQKLEQVLNNYKSDVEKQKIELSQNFKSRLRLEYGNNRSTTYLLAIDPYFYYRYTKNYLDHGYVGEEIRNGSIYDALKLAPNGVKIKRTPYHVYVEALWYKIMRIFVPGINLMHSTFFVPIVISMLAIIPIFFIGNFVSSYKHELDNKYENEESKKKGKSKFFNIGLNLALFTAFIAAGIAAMHPSFLGRTMGGFADTDAYNVLFPALIFLLFFYGVVSKNWKKATLFGSLAAIAQIIYVGFWPGWWYTFDTLLFGVILVIGIGLIDRFYKVIFIEKKNRKFVKKVKGILKLSSSEKQLVITAGTFIIAVLVLGFIFHLRLSSIYSAPMVSIQKIKYFKAPVKSDLWPNVYTTVAELNPASINSIIIQLGMGSLLVFILAGLGIVYLITKSMKETKGSVISLVTYLIGILVLLALRTSLGKITWLFLYTLIVLGIPLIWLILKEKAIKKEVIVATLLAVWLLAGIYTSTQGVRFILLAVPPMSIAIALGLEFLVVVGAKLINSIFNLDPKIASQIIIAIVLIIFFLPQQVVLGKSIVGNSFFDKSAKLAKNEVPSMNDAWYNTLIKIRDNSTKNAIITSWWDFGHWFAAIAERPVTFDGSSQNKPQAHWVGRILASKDEEESLAILRMLDCGGNNAFEELNKNFNDTEKTIKILYEILKMNKEEAYNKLKDIVGEKEAQKVIEYTHCDPPEAFLITSEDMVGKAPVWAHFGLWNFTKAKEVMIVKKYSKEAALRKLKEMGLSNETALQAYYEIKALPSNEDVNAWVSPWPNYVGRDPFNCNVINNIVNCSFSNIIARGQRGEAIVLKGIYVDLNNGDSWLQLGIYSGGSLLRNVKEKPSVLAIVKDNNTEFYYFNNTNFGLTVTEDGQVVISQPELAGSLFTRLFYLDGKGTKYFKKFSEDISVIGDKIIVWKVKWKK